MKNGFSLIELMVAVAIIGILAAIAYPTFSEHVYKSRRSDGQAALLNLATYMEHYYTENNVYTSSFNNIGISNLSADKYYTLSILVPTQTSYILTATPVGAQAGDTTCTTLTLTNTNVKAATPAANSLTCWQ